MKSDQYTTIRELQRDYKKIAKKVQESGEPLVIVTGNEPQFAVISLDALNKLQQRARNSTTAPSDKPDHTHTARALRKLADILDGGETH